MLRERGDDLVRVKCVVRSLAGRLLLQAVHRVVQSHKVFPDGPVMAQENTLVFIGRGSSTRALGQSLGQSLAHFASWADLCSDPEVQFAKGWARLGHREHRFGVIRVKEAMKAGKNFCPAADDLSGTACTGADAAAISHLS